MARLLLLMEEEDDPPGSDDGRLRSCGEGSIGDGTVERGGTPPVEAVLPPDPEEAASGTSAAEPAPLMPVCSSSSSFVHMPSN